MLTQARNIVAGMLLNMMAMVKSQRRLQHAESSALESMAALLPCIYDISDNQRRTRLHKALKQAFR